jgi:hypothetical protein
MFFAYHAGALVGDRLAPPASVATFATLAIAAFCVRSTPVAAQAEADAPALPRRHSVLVGGMAISSSGLAIAKVARDYGRFAAGLDVTFDEYSKRHTAPAEDYYRLWAYALTGRYYPRARGHGPFGELALANAHPELRAT